MERKEVINFLAALAQETRLDVFRALVQAGPEGLAAGAIGSFLGIPPATLSFHLKELKSSGLIQFEQVFEQVRADKAGYPGNQPGLRFGR